MVRTLQDGEVLGAEGHVIARDSYTQLIRWVLSEKGFHGKAAKADFHSNGFHYSFGSSHFKEGAFCKSDSLH